MEHGSNDTPKIPPQVDYFQGRKRRAGWYHVICVSCDLCTVKAPLVIVLILCVMVNPPYSDESIRRL